jgi:hypothetical protein
MAKVHLILQAQNQIIQHAHTILWKRENWNFPPLKRKSLIWAILMSKVKRISPTISINEETKLVR